MPVEVARPDDSVAPVLWNPLPPSNLALFGD